MRSGRPRRGDTEFDLYSICHLKPAIHWRWETLVRVGCFLVKILILVVNLEAIYRTVVFAASVLCVCLHDCAVKNLSNVKLDALDSFMKSI